MFPTIFTRHKVGTEGIGSNGEDISSVTFSVCNPDVDLIWDMVVGDFGIRETNTGLDRNKSVKLNSESACPVQPSSAPSEQPSSTPESQRESQHLARGA
jgi:hypothetical protein